MEPFQVHILAADKTFYEGPCVSLTIPTSDGEQGIWAHHAAMIAAEGLIQYRAGNFAPLSLNAQASIPLRAATEKD